MLPMLDMSVLNMEIFGQIMEMDDDPTHEFSRGIIDDFFTQAYSTVHKIKAAYPTNLVEVSRLGHYLKGSSATVGLSCVERSCQRIQQFAKLLDPDTEEVVSREVAYREVDDEIAKVRVLLEYCDAMLKRSFGAPLQDCHRKALSIPLTHQLAALKMKGRSHAPSAGQPYGQQQMLPVT